MKYLIGSILSEFNLFVLDGANAGEYETNDFVSIADIQQLLGPEPGNGVVVIETAENREAIKALLGSYDRGRDQHKIGLEIDTEGRANKAKNVPDGVLDLIKERRKNLKARIK